MNEQYFVGKHSALMQSAEVQTVSAIANSFRKLCENSASYIASAHPGFVENILRRHTDLRRTVPVHVVRPFVSGLCLLADASSDIASTQKIFSHLLTPHLTVLRSALVPAGNGSSILKISYDAAEALCMMSALFDRGCWSQHPSLVPQFLAKHVDILQAAFACARAGPQATTELVLPLLCGRRHGFLTKAISIVAKHFFDSHAKGAAMPVRVLSPEWYSKMATCAAAQFRTLPMAEALQLMEGLIVPARFDGAGGALVRALEDILLSAIIFSHKAAPTAEVPNPGSRMGDIDPPVVSSFCAFADEALSHIPAMFCRSVPRTTVQAASAGRAVASSVDSGGIVASLLEVLVIFLARHLHLQDRDASKAILRTLAQVFHTAAAAGADDAGAGGKKNGGVAPPREFGSALAGIVRGVGVALLKELLDGAGGTMPSWVIAEISDVIHGIVCAVGVAAFKSLGNAAFAAGALPSTSAAGQLAFLEDVACGKSRSDPSRLKRVLKSFCGGKKKGSDGTPGQPRQRNKPKGANS
eukprot:INCI5305.3.p1 GENE.INCI5305.3~~INCI5305.3.p1  ORF type:complete len:527 (+),score=94.38 INCI5305.3:359-1939(+)